MSLRITQGMMYSSFVNNMNTNLSAYMESNMQASSQKKVNRPSDAPVDSGRILNTRSSLARMTVYEENINQAMGWLNLADVTLGSGDGSVQSVLSRIKVLAEQAATGTYDGTNREEISFEVRELFSQLISLSNTTFEGRHIFAGHKTGSAAYEAGLNVTALDSTVYTSPQASLTDVNFKVTGDASKTIIIQATSGGPASTASYRYSDDGGTTWTDAGTPSLDVDTGMYTIHTAGAGEGANVSFFPADKMMANPLYPGTAGEPKLVPDTSDPWNPPQIYQVSPVDPDNVHSADNGTWLYVRPTAIYKGDDASTEVTSPYRPAGSNDKLTASADGHFSRDVIVRLDERDTSTSPPTLKYSYSTDDGSSWTSTSTPMPANGKEVTLSVPGGLLKVANGVDFGKTAPIPPATTSPDNGLQFVVHPHRANIDFQIDENDSITVNMVGMDIFGGMYDRPEDGLDYPVSARDKDSNIFETVGDLIAALETNSQEGCQQALERLSNCMNVVLTRAAEAGGRENRLVTAQGALLMRSYSESDNLSAMEDVDITVLMTKLAQQQTAYNSVLKSSSMIMQMSLVNFL